MSQQPGNVEYHKQWRAKKKQSLDQLQETVDTLLQERDTLNEFCDTLLETTATVNSQLKRFTPLLEATDQELNDIIERFQNDRHG